MSPTRHRRAGSRWRLLVHNMAPGGASGVSRHFKSHEQEGRIPRGVASPVPADLARRFAEIAAQHSVEMIVPGTEFDELVVGRWCHIEQMGPGHYWANIAGVVLNVRVDRDGRAILVWVDHEPVDGVTYLGEIDGAP